MNGGFRALALTAVVAGAGASIGLMFLAGSRQRSLFLMGLFTGWVLSPFLAFGWAAIVSKRWSPSNRAMLCAAIPLVTLVSVAMYGGILPMPSGSRPAAVFLMVPLGSWVLIAIAAFFGARPWPRD